MVGLFVLAGVATWLVHRETLHYGFDYDDYYFLRPHTRAEVLADGVGYMWMFGPGPKFTFGRTRAASRSRCAIRSKRFAN